MSQTVRIALTLADGALAIMAFVTRGFVDNPEQAFAEGLPTQFEREASPEAITAEIAKTGLAVKSWRIIADTDVPTHRAYRDAWVDDGTAIVHDLPKAREIHRSRIRARRTKLFAALTVEQERAGRNAAKLDAIEARRQRLRDAPADPRIDAAQTIEELTVVNPLEES